MTVTNLFAVNFYLENYWCRVKIKVTYGKLKIFFSSKFKIDPNQKFKIESKPEKEMIFLKVLMHHIFTYKMFSFIYKTFYNFSCYICISHNIFCLFIVWIHFNNSPCCMSQNFLHVKLLMNINLTIWNVFNFLNNWNI